ncbi:MAG: rhodanese-like domain-containing protein [Akkermansiaceae bacterium]
MIKSVFILAVSAVVVSCSSREKEVEAEVVVEAEAEVREVVVFDVRTAGEFAGGHLEGAINVPYREIGDKVADFVKRKDAEIIVYCKSGGRSEIARKKLTGMGYTDVTNAGSYDDLKE